MEQSLHKATYILLASLGLSLIFNFLFFGKLIGVSLLIFTVLLLGTVFLFGLREKLAVKKTWWLAALVIFFALMPAIRANPFLTFLNICAVFGLLMVLAHQLVDTPAWVMKLRDYLVLAVLVPFRMLARALSTVSVIGQVHSNVKDRDVWIRIIKGVIMALPILVIFGILFSQADAAFSQFIKGFINISISVRTAQYLLLLAFAFVAGLSFLSYIFFPKPAVLILPDEQSNAVVESGKGIEMLVFLGLIVALFLIFISFQITYLFGGQTNIVIAGFTYAEYARRGFWELLAVAMLSLVLLVAAEKYVGVELKKDRKFLIPALVLIAEVVVVMASAFMRLYLYIDAYGMTVMRFYVAGFIILLLVLFAQLAYKFIKSKQEQFLTFGALLSIAGFLVAINILNPDGFVIKANIKQFESTGKIDTYYIGELSGDAESGKIELYRKLEGEDKEILRNWLEEDQGMLEFYNNHWQSANVSRTKALELLNGSWE